ncbi:MAG: non-homologous end-joining DNA ligase [Bacillota bacterium]|nr:non-homologous end-joining DNA ligase [Bacillota bacterium]
MKWSVGQLKPMEPQWHSEPFDSPQHLFEIKWDGMRVLSFINHKGVRLQNRHLQERTDLFPELGDLPYYIQAQEAILDGEVIVLADQKPSFPLLMKRCLASSPRGIASLVQTLPALYIIFDILYLNGTELVDKPLVERKKFLTEIFKTGPFCSLSPVFNKNGKSLFDAVKKEELEGIVAKEQDAPYLIGKKSRYWLKIKARRHQLAVIGGYLLKHRILNTLLVGAFSENKLHYLGRVGTGPVREKTQLLSILDSLRTNRCPFTPLPRLQTEAVWVLPQVVVEIEFQEWTPELRLRHPVFKKMVQKPPEVCQLFSV